jgi:signal peptidase II
MYFYLIIVLSIVIDLATKIAIRMNLDIGEKSEIGGGFIRLTHLVNTGSSGNMFHGWGRVLAFGVIILVGIALYFRAQGKFRGAPMQVGVALFIGGALGNTIDRIIYNQVTDFLYFSEQATMNFADIWVFVGFVIILASQAIQLFKPEAASS